VVRKLAFDYDGREIRLGRWLVEVEAELLFMQALKELATASAS